MKKVVAVVSGGLDSTTVLGLLMEESVEIYPLTFSYGQRHSIEKYYLQKSISHYRHLKTNGLKKAILHPLIEITLPEIQCLLTSDRPLPEGDTERDGIAPTYVPGRNTIFIAHALSIAERIGAKEIYLGVNFVDYSGYPDCRPEYIEEWNELSALCNEVGVKGNPIEIIAPLMDMSKAEIIKKGMSIGVPYQYSWSCYKGQSKPCGECDSCKIRLAGFDATGHEDPLTTPED